MFDHMRGIEDIHLSLRERSPLPYIPSMHSGTRWISIKIDPGIVMDGTAADINQEHREKCNFLVEYLQCNTTCVVNSIKQHLDAMLCNIFINCRTGTLPVTIVINNENPSTAQAREKVRQLMFGRFVPVRIQPQKRNCLGSLRRD